MIDLLAVVLTHRILPILTINKAKTIKKNIKNTRQEWSRRTFIASIAGTGVAIGLNPLWSWAISDEDPQVARIVANTIGIDTHNHVDVPLDKAELPGPELALSDEIKKSGLSAIVMTFATDYKRNVQPGEAYERFLNGLDAMDTALSDNGMKRALTLADIQTAHKKHTPTVIQSVEARTTGFSATKAISLSTAARFCSTWPTKALPPPTTPTKPSTPT